MSHSWLEILPLKTLSRTRTSAPMVLWNSNDVFPFLLTPAPLTHSPPPLPWITATILSINTRQLSFNQMEKHEQLQFSLDHEWQHSRTADSFDQWVSNKSFSFQDMPKQAIIAQPENRHYFQFRERIYSLLVSMSAKLKQAAYQACENENVLDDFG